MIADSLTEISKVAVPGMLAVAAAASRRSGMARLVRSTGHTSEPLSS